MIRHRNPSSRLTLIILLTGTCLPSLLTPSPIDTTAGVARGGAIPRMPLAGYRGIERGQGSENGNEEKETSKKKEEEEEELFKGVDPKTLAAVLLEAFNKPQAGRAEMAEEDGVGGGVTEDEERGEDEAEAMTEDPKKEEVRATEEVNRDRDRGREQPELELVMAVAALQGKEEREREEELEQKKSQEEEERLTERVTSRTVSHVIPVKTVQQSGPISDKGAEAVIDTVEGGGKGQGSRPTPLSNLQLEGEQRNEEEEEQLNPEELKNLETMMKEFPSLGAASKRVGNSDESERESRGFNDVLLQYKDKDLPMTKKKLRWQEETQKAMPIPAFRGGNFMDEFEDHSNAAGSNSAQPMPSQDASDVMEEEDDDDDDEQEVGEDNDELLSPEEEEARAKAEQEEVLRQAAEVQRAKMEEEKLADIASDMLLRYMVKQNGGKRKYREQNRKYSSLLNTAEDKRSNEVQEVDEDDDIDPQTIDKLIEISSKLHLPAEDVVDIISDVEKKKKKDMPSEITSLSPWLQPSWPPSSLSSTKGNMLTQIPANQNSFPGSKQPLAAINPLKTWFQEDPRIKSSLTNQELWRKPVKPQPPNIDLLPKLQNPLSTNKGQRTFWNSFPSYAIYPHSYQKMPYRGYYPIYFAPRPQPKPRYYIPKTVYTLDNLLRNAARYDYNFPPKRHFHNWIQPRLRRPPEPLQKSYYNNYVLPTYLRKFQRLPVANHRSPPRIPGLPPSRNGFYFAPRAPVFTRDRDYYDTHIDNQADDGNYDDVDIQHMLTKGPRMFQ